MTRRGVLLCTLAGLACKSEPALEELTFTGMMQSEVRARIGEPDEIEELRKTSEHIFGPFETVWSRIAMGDRVVTWAYETRRGRKELYFAGDDKKVAAEFFWYHDESKNPVF